MLDTNNSYDEAAEEAILNLLWEDGVAFRNELRYRLERPSPYSEIEKYLSHEVISRKLDDLEKREIIQTTNLRGRKKDIGLKPLLFYRLKNSDYTVEIQELIKIKRNCSHFISGLSSYAGFYSQRLWKEAIDEKNITILDKDTNEFNNNEASSNKDIDLLIEYKGCNFGVEVKNTFSYPNDIKGKYRVAAEMDVVPLFISRTISHADRKYLKSY